MPSFLERQGREKLTKAEVLHTLEQAGTVVPRPAGTQPVLEEVRLGTSPRQPSGEEASSEEVDGNICVDTEPLHQEPHMYENQQRQLSGNLTGFSHGDRSCALG